MEELLVWAERIEGFVLVGTLNVNARGDESFTYDRSYLESDHPYPLFPVLPLQTDSFETAQTRAAFYSLGPEGPVGHDIRIALHAGRDEITPVLARLNHETVGALTFTSPTEKPSYTTTPTEELDATFFEEFARDPERVAHSTLLETRLSLNGAVSKIGVAEIDGAWHKTFGLMPSTHIMKAGTVTFPHQMLNEALCMRCAAACGFDDAAQTTLIPVDSSEPILVSRRFDRIIIPDRPKPLPIVMRLHQADFCQALGISVDALKYTPSDELIEGYTTSIANAVSHESSERYGDRSYVFDILAFDYLIGNCDNHLKNLSFTWSPDWHSKSVSPIYDVTCTTIYEDLSREMGLGVGRHRTIDQIEPQDFPLMARQLAVGWRQLRDSLSETAEMLGRTLLDCAHTLETECGVQALEVAESLVKDSRERVEIAKRASLLS